MSSTFHDALHLTRLDAILCLTGASPDMRREFAVMRRIFVRADRHRAFLRVFPPILVLFRSWWRGEGDTEVRGAPTRGAGQGGNVLPAPLVGPPGRPNGGISPRYGPRKLQVSNMGARDDQIVTLLAFPRGKEKRVSAFSPGKFQCVTVSSPP